MLKPAILFKEEIESKFAEIMYTRDAFFYNGYCHACEPLQVDSDECAYRYAVVDKDDNVIGFFSYSYNWYTDSIERFGLISFDKNNVTVVADVLQEMRRLVKTYRRIEWQCVGSNPVNKVYERFCKKYNGHITVHHKCVREINGEFVDSITYEIVNER